jgi:methylenetetrahydrofolate reductase (NADPH)
MRVVAFVMDSRVPGTDVPAGTIAQVQQAAAQEDAAYELALEQAEHALSLPGVRGLHITDFRHDGAVSRLCRDLGIPTKEERRAHAHRAQLPV